MYNFSKIMMLLTASLCLLFIGCSKDEILPNDLTSKAKQAQKLPGDGEISEKVTPPSGCNCEYRITDFTDDNTGDNNHLWQARVYSSGTPYSPSGTVYSGLQGNLNEDWNIFGGSIQQIYPTDFQPFQLSPNADPLDIQSERLAFRYNGEVDDNMDLFIHIRCISGDGTQTGNQYFTVNEPDDFSGFQDWWVEDFCVSCRAIAKGECQPIGPG